MTNKTPRQSPGHDYVPLTVLVSRQAKDALWQLALDRKRSLAEVTRDVLDQYLEELHRARVQGAG